MICAISDEVPEDPVLSKNSGMLFERRLIERYIEDHAMCPVTKEELTMDVLVRMKTNKVAKPRPLQAASVPGLLGMFQNEWDALMLSNFALEQQLHTARQEVPPSLAPIDALERYTPISSHPLHKTNKPGILSTDIYPSKGIIATGGIDTNAVLWIGRLLKSCARSLVTQRRSLPSCNEDRNYGCRQTFKDNAAEVEAVTVHATQKYFVSEASGQEGYTSATFHPGGLILGIGTSEAVVKIWDVKTQSNVAKFDGYVGPVTAMSFSENGYFLATAALDGVKLWDLRKLRNFRTLSPYDPDTPVNSVEFDE